MGIQGVLGANPWEEASGLDPEAVHPSSRTMPTTCALCRRVVPDERIADPQVVQEHHLRPEERATSPTVMLCRPCHDQIHAIFTNDELRDDYIAWIRGTDKLDIQLTTSARKRDRRG